MSAVPESFRERADAAHSTWADRIGVMRYTTEQAFLAGMKYMAEQAAAECEDYALETDSGERFGAEHSAHLIRALSSQLSDPSEVQDGK